MTTISLNRDADKRPKYLRFADWVRKQIDERQLLPGQQLLSYAEIEAQFGFSQNTVERAYGILEQEGLIFRELGRGVFVAEPEVPSGSLADTGFVGYVDDLFKYSKDILYHTQLMTGVRSGAGDADKQLVVISSSRTFQHWKQLEGVILCAAGHDPSYSGDTFRAMLPPQMPVVNCLLPISGISSVLSDDADGIQQLVAHLSAFGHQRIALFSEIRRGPLKDHPLVRLRCDAYRSALRRHQIEPDESWIYSPALGSYASHYEFGYEGMKGWLDAGWKETSCTAIVAHNDLTAMGIVDALREAGLAVPGDVSVVGFDHAEVHRTAPYNLTTIEVPLQKMGAMAMKVLLDQIRDPSQKPKDVILSVEFVPGQTTGPVPGK